jgi:hypothetical protein
MSARRQLPAVLALLLVAAAALPAGASAVAHPAWSLTLNALPSNLAPGGRTEVLAIATNVGGEATSGESVVEVSLPPEVVPVEARGKANDPNAPPPCEFEALARKARCRTSESIQPGDLLVAEVTVEASGLERTADLQATVSGGGTSQQAAVTFPASVQTEPIPFDFLPGFAAPANEADGFASTLAGSHPYQQTVDFGFPTKEVGGALSNDGHARDFSVELPRGMVGDPAASPVLCTEAELVGEEGCPDGSQLGVTDVTTLALKTGINGFFTSPLYNMVPPPGYPAEIATEIGGIGIFVHVLVEVRSADQYRIEAEVRDAIAFGQQPIFAAQSQIWGDPSASAHDHFRGGKHLPSGEVPLLTMPGDCSGLPLGFDARTDSWEEPSPPGPQHEALYESADLEGKAVSLTGCEALSYEPAPTIEARPTTNLTDSPSGLEFDLHQPQEEPHPEPLSGRASATLKDATVTLPAGMAVNPSQAAGLGACTEAQIGYEGQQEGRLRFSEAPQSCPDAAKLGTVSATSPALVQRNEAHEVLREEGKPVLEALHGSIYLAQPFANPFGKLVAVYLVVEDEKTGVHAKLAGEGELDPKTGQITTRFTENPELPLQDVRVSLFGGSRSALITPPVCGTYTTKADLTPWSAPEASDAFPTDSFQPTAAPGGGPCPTQEAQLPNAPKLTAGALSPAAGKYSPLLFKLSREDGTQRLGGIEATLPSGLLAKLAGVEECSEADIAQAKSREKPEMGALEQADPSCPAASEVGTVVAGAGAGPTPYYTTGYAYLAGPYRGAPLSLVAIAPAVAGPFDLGAVVVRSALYVDPTTAQGKVVSDPLPQVLDGVPVDLRSVAVNASRPQFTLNPTSCDEKSFGGRATSTLGLPAPLFERFQVGGCSSLAFKPKLHLRLFGPTHRGAHPRLRAVLESKPGEANIARTSLTLPRSEFIDQAHFRTICTRVQYAANQCPAGAIYGHVKAISPLLAYPLEGAIYLRSSSQELPDTVFALRGPAWQPLALDAVGHVDSVKGRLRVTFPEIPDAPLSKAIITMQGAKKGLFQNSTDICRGEHRAVLQMDGQNGKANDSRPPLQAKCKGGQAKKPKGGGKAGRGRR